MASPTQRAIPGIPYRTAAVAYRAPDCLPAAVIPATVGRPSGLNLEEFAMDTKFGGDQATVPGRSLPLAIVSSGQAAVEGLLPASWSVPSSPLTALHRFPGLSGTRGDLR